MGERRIALILLLILAFAVVTISEIGIVKAESTIYIRADGSVEGTDTIQRNGDIYTLTADISGEIKVEKNFIVIDGAGYILQGNGEGNGIDISTRNVTVMNMRIVNFARGIFSLSNNTIMGNYIADCGTGIGIIGGSNNIIKNNTLANNVNPISIAYSGGGHVITENSMINGTFIIIWLSPEPDVDRNYWSDYNGTDADGDGIGDIPYVYGGNQESKYIDEHPLIDPVPVIPENNLNLFGFLSLGIILLTIKLIYIRKEKNGKQ